MFTSFSSWNCYAIQVVYSHESNVLGTTMNDECCNIPVSHMIMMQYS